MGARNKERHVPSAACNPEKKALEIDNDLGTNTYEGKPSTLGKQQGEQLRKVAGDLSV